jgi:hypothetical protein
MRGELTYKRKEGIERKYLSVSDFQEPIFERNKKFMLTICYFIIQLIPVKT